MTTSLTLLGQTIEIVTEDIVVSEIEQDEDGYYVHEFKFYGEAATVGGDLPVVLTVRAKSLTQTKVLVTAPPSTF